MGPLASFTIFSLEIVLYFRFVFMSVTLGEVTPFSWFLQFYFRESVHSSSSGSFTSWHFAVPPSLNGNRNDEVKRSRESIIRKRWVLTRPDCDIVEIFEFPSTGVLTEFSVEK
ncbi:hypothetical protein AVEN_26824-1 [Araneus ventricosus]|uniref:Uncharacterized protein n=1 Tax=Araneus ventricosus TaxID=182803 RepID=A0A4Y2KIM3_ARAVE|nr:hypothetical protein AVEN_26824-1 [Araneus ventricosus]